MPISRKFFPEGGGPKDIEFFQMGGGGGPKHLLVLLLYEYKKVEFSNG